MTSIIYLGCPAGERDDAERLLRDGHVSVVWADNVAYALDELGRRDIPVLVDLSRGAAALQLAQEIRTHRASTLMFAVVDERRPDLTTEAVLAGVADVFARPVGGRRVTGAIERELNYESCDGSRSGDELYSHSPAMRPVIALIDEAAAKRAGVLDPGRGRDRTPGRRARDSRAAERVRGGVCHRELRRLRHRGARRRAVRRERALGELRGSGVARPGPRQP
jgi:DNA-binding NtrC family response regulator